MEYQNSLLEKVNGITMNLPRKNENPMSEPMKVSLGWVHMACCHEISMEWIHWP